MTATLADFAAQQQAKQDIADAVLRHTYSLCEALRQNFVDYSIQQHERSIDYADSGDVASVRYHESCIEKLKQGDCGYEFTFETGRKYHKIIMNDGTQHHVHAFIDKKTGEVYKSASWKSPAKGVRYDLRLIVQREWLLENATWCGGYLYAR
jgi:hypothetical protein